MVLIGDLPAPVSAIVAEGIEDALTGACLTGVAAIATLGSGRLPKLSLEKGAQVVLLAQQKSDKDQLLWDKAGQIFAAQGAQVEIVWPGNRGDINELLTTDGPEAVKAAIADAEPVVVKPDAPVASEGDIPDLDGMNDRFAVVPAPASRGRLSGSPWGRTRTPSGCGSRCSANAPRSSPARCTQGRPPSLQKYGREFGWNQDK